MIVGFRLSQSLNLTRHFPVAFQNTVQLSYEIGDLAKARLEDWGGELALYLGRKQCGLNLTEMGALAGGIDYATISNRFH